MGRLPPARLPHVESRDVMPRNRKEADPAFFKCVSVLVLRNCKPRHRVVRSSCKIDPCPIGCSRHATDCSVLTYRGAANRGAERNQESGPSGPKGGRIG